MHTLEKNAFTVSPFMHLKAPHWLSVALQLCALFHIFVVLIVVAIFVMKKLCSAWMKCPASYPFVKWFAISFEFQACAGSFFTAWSQ